MDSELISQLFQIVIIPLLGAVTVFIVKWINAKAAQIKTQTTNETTQKYIDLLTQTITDCVTATNQTYVNALKDKGEFDASAQKEAFQKTYEAVLSILNSEAYTYIQNAVGDIQTYLTTKIEAEVSNKKSTC